MLRLLYSILLCLAVFSLAVAEPVSTNQFGFIRPGMPEGEVLRRLGDPDHRQVMRRYAVGYSTRGQGIAELREEVLLIYKGDGRIMDTFIVIDNGVVKQADKRR